MMNAIAPVITFDGPSGVGKGTVASCVARRLGFTLLDSGAIYRGIALAAARAGIPSSNTAGLIALIERTHLVLVPASDHDELRLWCDGEDVSAAIRSPQCSHQASIIAAIGAVREALLGYQRQYQAAPGLVADGRDMGTVVFPQAALKIFLQADVVQRARRRWRQLQLQDADADFDNTLQDLQQRDQRDLHRTVAPLRPAETALIIDTTQLTIVQVVSGVLHQAAKRGIGTLPPSQQASE